MLGSMDADLVVTPALTVPAAELQWRFSRSSGPGGQGVNTTDSRVELTWHLGESAVLPPATLERLRAALEGRLTNDAVVVAASEYRSQLRNRQAARTRLAALLRAALAPPPAARRARRPSAGARRRRLEDKRHRSEVKRMRRADPS